MWLVFIRKLILTTKKYPSISVLPSLSKVYEKIYKQLNLFFETKLSPHLSGLRSRYITQHALSNLLFNWQYCLDKSGVVAMFLKDLFKEFDCLPHDLTVCRMIWLITPWFDCLHHDLIGKQKPLKTESKGFKLESAKSV